MPFCSQCGNQVGDADQFCGRCGSPQPGATPPPRGFNAAPPPPPRPAVPGRDPLASIDSRTASILCYLPGLGWIMAIVVLAAERFRNDRYIRFHGFQGLYLFVAWMIEQQVLGPMMRQSNLHPLHSLLTLVLLGASVLMMIKAANREAYALPLIGELAQKSMSEE